MDVTTAKEFEALFHGRGVGVARVSMDGQFTSVNQYLADLLGYSVSELETKKWQEITHPEDVAADLAMVAKLIAGESHGYHMEKRYLHRRTNNSVWVDLHVRAIRDAAEKCTHFIIRVIPLPEVTVSHRGDDGSEIISPRPEVITIPKSWLLWLKDNWKTLAILVSLATGGSWKAYQSMVETQSKVEHLQRQLEDSKSNVPSRDR